MAGSLQEQLAALETGSQQAPAQQSYQAPMPANAGGVSEISPLEAGAQSAYAGLSEASKLFYEYAPPALMLDKLGILNREEANEALDTAAKQAYSEYKKYKPEIGSYKDIETGGDLLTYVGDNLALGMPQIVSLFLGPTGLAMLGMEATGSTLIEQEEGGHEKNIGRAILTGTAEAAMNLPISKAAKGIFNTIDKTNLDEIAKKNLTTELVQGIGADVGLSGLQQIVRNYGVEGEFSTKNLDEALVGGLIMSTPIRGANALTNTATKDKLADSVAEYAVETGDIKKADGFLQNIANFTYGEALRPLRRIKDLPVGKQIFDSIRNMQESREVMAHTFTSELDGVLKSVKNQDDFFDAYAAGKRDTPQLQKLQELMDGIHNRGNDVNGANLGIKYINNYLPTIMDAKLFDTPAKAALKNDYAIWYKNNASRIMKEAKAMGKEITLVTPRSANRMIDAYKVNAPKDAFKMPKIKQKEDGTFTAPNPVDVKSPLKSGALEHSRMLGFIPQHLLQPYSVKEGRAEQLKQYAFGAAQRVTYAEQLGKNNERLNVALATVGNELKNKGEDFALNHHEVDTLYNTLDAYQGIYNQFETEGARRLASYARSITNIVALPLTFFSSLTEPFNLAIKVGHGQAFKAFIKSLRSMSQDLISTITNGAVPKSEVNKQLLLTGRSFKNATTALNNRLNGEHMSTLNKTGTQALSSITWFNNKFFHITGQTTINYLVNSMAAHAAQGQVKNDLMIINGYKNSQLGAEAAARLNAVGIPASQFKELHNNSKLLDEYMPTIVAKFNRDVALDPTALDKPLWMSTGWGAMFGQLKGYPTMFANTVLPKLLSTIDTRGKSKVQIAKDVAEFSSTVGGILFVGFMQETIKSEIKGGSETDEEIFIKAVKNTVVPIQAGILYDAVIEGKIARTFTPAAAGITESTLSKVLKGEDAKLEDLPFFSSFKGLL